MPFVKLFGLIYLIGVFVLLLVRGAESFSFDKEGVETSVLFLRDDVDILALKLPLNQQK
jgi:hypothetical protein